MDGVLSVHVHWYRCLFMNVLTCIAKPNKWKAMTWFSVKIVFKKKSEHNEWYIKIEMCCNIVLYEYIFIVTNVFC